LFKSAVVFLIFFALINARDVFAQNDMEDNMTVRQGYSDSPFGVLEFLHWDHDWNNHKYPDEESLKKCVGLMKKAGVGIVRMDFLWQDIEPAPGKWDFAKYDRLVDLLTANDIRILGILDYTADWASPKAKWNCPDSDHRSFVKYCIKTAQRYKDRIKYWEVWNEPDSRIYWSEQDGLKDYCLMLKEVYAALKEVDPGCVILNGGLANGLVSVNKLYDNGAAEYFDILNIHIFESPLDKDGIKRAMAYIRACNAVMSRNKDQAKKIWITEIGSPGVKGGKRVNNWWMGVNPNERQQAQWLKKVYANLLKEEKVEKVFWAFFRDTRKHWDNGIDYFGLVRWDFSEKPSFKAYQNISSDR